MNRQVKSKCCDAELKVSQADEGTCCFICTKCGKPSDMKVEVPMDAKQYQDDIKAGVDMNKNCLEQVYGTKDYPSFWKTIVESKEGKAWYKEMMKRFRKMADAPIGKVTEHCFDVDESFECGWMSPAHWREFVKFIKQLK